MSYPATLARPLLAMSGALTLNTLKQGRGKVIANPRLRLYFLFICVFYPTVQSLCPLVGDHCSLSAGECILGVAGSHDHGV